MHLFQWFLPLVLCPETSSYAAAAAAGVAAAAEAAATAAAAVAAAVVLPAAAVEKKSSLSPYHGWCYSQTRDSTRALFIMLGYQRYERSEFAD